MRAHSTLYLLNTALKCPNEALFSFLIFILCLQLGASPFQLMILACLKPISSIFSFFISAILDQNPHRVRLYLILNILAESLPCLFFLIIDDVWYYIAAYALMMVCSRAAFPAWIEFLKCSVEKKKLSGIISKATSIEYGCITFLPTLMALGIDRSPNLWRWMFFFGALLRLSSIGLIFFMKGAAKMHQRENARFDLHSLFLDPLIKGVEILKKRPAFGRYLVIFFIGGAGVIGTQPLLPLFFKQELNLSYTELAFAFSFCKGISFILTSPLWAKLANRTSLYIVNCLMNLFTCLFFFLLLAACGSVFWIYPAYVFYGMMQAGCKLSWNMSGAVFSNDEESTFYSSMNLALVGIRGAICPYLGYLLFSWTNSTVVFSLSFGLCFFGILYGLWIERKSASLQPAAS